MGAQCCLPKEERPHRASNLAPTSIRFVIGSRPSRSSSKLWIAAYAEISTDAFKLADLASTIQFLAKSEMVRVVCRISSSFV